tara:strand:+ start:5554 stop:6276 length:723 start_codon:yes stop_codon:yes gene_type:complete
MEVLILGHKGMLGSMVHKYYEQEGIKCITTDYRWPSNEFKNFIKNFNGDAIINCIAITSPSKKGIAINHELPKYLDQEKNCKIIHPGTDSENEVGLYAASKFSASYYINTVGKNTKIIRSSIIGPEINPKPYLFEYIIDSNEITLSNKAKWNGSTTLYWAQFSLKLLSFWDNYDVDTIIGSECNSKFELANIIKDVFDLKTDITSTDEVVINRCLKQLKYKIPIKEQLIDLKDFMHIYNQ